VSAAARVSVSTEKGASPSKSYVGAARRVTGEAPTSERNSAVAIERILNYDY
jgi:hypothetical protein